MVLIKAYLFNDKNVDKCIWTDSYEIENVDFSYERLFAIFAKSPVNCPIWIKECSYQAAKNMVIVEAVCISGDENLNDLVTTVTS